MYLLRDNIKISYNKYKVPSSRNGIYHIVDMNDWSCTCESFNYGCYTYKHMFYIMIDFRCENKVNHFKELKNIENIFNFIKETCLTMTKDENLKEMIKFQNFPVTIGENAFKIFFKKVL